MKEQLSIIDTIVEKLQSAEKMYYTDGNSTLSDQEFDDLKNKLEKIDPDNRYLTVIGAEDIDSTEWVKHTHECPLGSLGKVNTNTELEKWFKNYDLVVIQPKLDGMSIALTYENGHLIRGVTRGKGGVGDDITRNVKRMKGVPHSIAYKDTLIVRGEVVITYEDFYAIPEDKRKKTPRNMVSGAAKKRNGEQCHILTVVVYDVMNDVGLETERDMFALLEKNDFPFIAEGKYFTNLSKTLEHLDHIANDRKFYGYDIDGMVLKNDIINLNDDWKKPKEKVAWKFKSETATTILCGVRISVSGDRIQPVAILKDVECGGVTISAASLHNWERVETLKLRVGSKVLISRRNDVIPQVEQVLEAGDGVLIKRPLECPSCWETCEWEQNTDGSQSKFLICPNEECESKVTKSIMKWLTVHETKGIATATVELLYDNEMFHDLPSFIDLHNGNKDGDIVHLGGMGYSKLKTLKEQIKNTLTSNTVKFFGGLNLSGSGVGTMERICNSILEFNPTASAQDLIVRVKSPYEVGLSLVEGFGEPSAKKLQDQFTKKCKLICDMMELIDIHDMKAPEKSSVTGKSFCFTGAMDQPNMKRKDAEKLVKSKGGSAKSSVGKDLDFLVTDDPIDEENGSSKMKKSCKLGITIITSDQFLQMIG